MTDPRYEHVGDRADHLIEECAELIKALVKAKRFGWEHYWGEGGNRKSNTQAVLEEMNDVQKRCIELVNWIDTTTPKQRTQAAPPYGTDSTWPEQGGGND